MSDVSPYGTTQNPDAAAVTANALTGTPVGSTRENAAIAGVGPAVLSTAPYVPPRSEQKRGVKGCYGRKGECGAPAIRGTDLCWFHSQEGAA